MDRNFKKLDGLIRHHVCSRGFPAGAVISVRHRGRPVYEQAYGCAQVTPRREAIRYDTVFDLASLTKPLATAMAASILAEENELKLDDPAGKYLREFARRPNRGLLIKNLLCHSAGLPSWFPLYAFDDGERMRYLSRARARGRGAIYSCLDYIIAGHIIERITGTALDAFCRQRIFSKTGLVHTGFHPRARTNVAATEKGNGHERRKALRYCRERKRIDRVKWRDRVIRGEVHDGNSFYACRGVAGNAGMFSNVPDLAKYLDRYLAGSIVKHSTVAKMTRDHTPWSRRERFGLGWKIDMYPGILSPRSFGHTGFTGPMIAVDPSLDLVIVFLANSVHPRVRAGRMPRIRREIVRAAVDAVK